MLVSGRRIRIFVRNGSQTHEYRWLLFMGSDI